MSKCDEIQKELHAYLSNDIGEIQKSQIQEHLKDCRNCSQALLRLTRLSQLLQNWSILEPSTLMYEKLKTRIKNPRSIQTRIFTLLFGKKAVLQLAKVAAIVAVTLSINHWFFEPVPEKPDETATINLFFKEHQDVAARTASLDISTPPQARIYSSQRDILYYEFFDDQPEFIRPGIIVRGPSYEQTVAPPEVPAIANGHTLTLYEAREAAKFDLVSPPRLHPGYMLDQVRRIEDRDALHLLYTDGINTLSLFEQPLEGQRGLVAQDFREYAVYRNEEQAAGRTILAWRDDTLSYVLIGNVDMPQLMDMAQSISAGNER